jgi:hypothetical protein
MMAARRLRGLRALEVFLQLRDVRLRFLVPARLGLLEVKGDFGVAVRIGVMFGLSR